MLEPGAILQERFEIQRQLGQGGYGAVYQAYHKHLQHSVAIKEMHHRGDPSFANHFEQEARMLSKLQHAGLPKVSDYFLEKDGFYFVMEYIPGSDLGEYVQASPNHYLDVPTALQIITPLLAVLNYLHGQNPPVIHRDIKPANIRITPDKAVYLVDFGIARVYDPHTKTSTAVRAVTSGFSPFEQYQQGLSEPRTDLYALGATLYYMLSGVTPPDAVQRIRTDPLQPLGELNPAVPSYLEAIVHRLLAIYPDQRYPDVAHVQRALEQQRAQPEPELEPSMSDFERINTLRVALQKAITERKANEQPNLLERVALTVLETNLARLERIEQLLRIEQYKLIFVGSIGAGKTTAICHLLNLVHEKEVQKKGKGKSQSAKPIRVTRELLTTGSGRTTICEVVIQPAPITALEIVPYDSEELTEQIESFCRTIWAKAYPTSSSDDAEQSLEQELIRAIRNVTELPEIRVVVAKDAKDDQAPDGVDEVPDERDAPRASDQSDASTKSSKSVDKALELAQQFQPDQFDAFHAEVLERAKIDQRTETRVSYTAEAGLPEAEWLYKYFAEINLVRNPTFSIPRQITLSISPALLDLKDDLYARFSAIIDTRGLDGQSDRPDLQAYIRDSDNVLCVFTDSFTKAPDNIAAIMRRYLTAEAHDTVTRSMLMILTRDSEPENVVGGAGPVGDRDEGIVIRRGQIEAELKKERINLAPDNIIFYDALQFYRKEGTDHRRDPDYTLEDIEQEREAIFAAFNETITVRHQKLRDQVGELEQRFQQIQTGDRLSRADEALITAVKDDLKPYRPAVGIARLDRTNFIEDYIKFWMPKHAGRLRAINRRYGIYDSIDIYFSAKSKTEDVLRATTEGMKDEIRQNITRIKEEAEARDVLTSIVDTFLEEVDRKYKAFIEDLGKDMSVHLEQKVFAPQGDTNEFWQNVERRFGKGPGYKDDVTVMYTDHLKEGKVPEYLQKQAKRGWEAFVDDILKFFG